MRIEWDKKPDQVAVFTTRISQVRSYIATTRKKMDRKQIRCCAKSLGMKSTMVVDCLNRINREKGRE